MKHGIVLFPVFFAAFPVLALYNKNINETPMRDLLLPFGAVIIATIILWSALSLLIRNTLKAGLLTTLFLVLFFSYGQIQYCLIKSFGIQWNSTTDRVFALGNIAVLIAGVVFVLRTRGDLGRARSILNITTGLLVIFSLVQIVQFHINHAGGETPNRYDSRLSSTLPAVDTEKLPNIYYVILDGYGRSDVLRDIYQVNNEPFLDALTSMGFYVDRHSRVNYGQTLLSLGSSMNMTYLDDLAKRAGQDTTDRAPAIDMLLHNQVSDFLRKRGYRVVALSSGIPSTEMRNADVFIDFPEEHDNVSEFTYALLCTTPCILFSATLFPPNQFVTHRRHVQRELAALADTTRLRGPIFVFAHVVCPHPPFVFEADGKPHKPSQIFSMNDGSAFLDYPVLGTKEDYLSGYRGQITYLNKRVIPALQQLIARSQRPTIIVLQSDHGPGSKLNWDDPDQTDMRERMYNLSAYYFWDGGPRKQLYDGMTPVNTFRVIFNHYFDQRYPLLPDKSYFSTWVKPYRFIEVTDRVNVR